MTSSDIAVVLAAETPWTVREDGPFVLVETATGREIRLTSSTGDPVEVLRAAAAVLNAVRAQVPGTQVSAAAADEATVSKPRRTRAKS